MLYNMEQIKNAIKTALFNKISANNPRLADAIAYRSTHRQLYASGDGASFYDSNGTYKTELQTYLASIKVEINNILGDGELKKYLSDICLYNIQLNQPEDLFDEDPILCY